MIRTLGEPTTLSPEAMKGALESTLLAMKDLNNRLVALERQKLPERVYTLEMK